MRARNVNRQNKNYYLFYIFFIKKTDAYYQFFSQKLIEYSTNIIYTDVLLLLLGKSAQNGDNRKASRHKEKPTESTT